MDQELHQRLLAIENKLDTIQGTVSKMQRSQRNARNRKLLYWLAIIALSIVSYYSIKPYLEELKGAYGVGTDTTAQYGDLLKTINE